MTAGEIDDVLKNPYSGVGSGHEHDAGAPGRWSGVAIRDSRIASHASYHGPRSLRFAQAHHCSARVDADLISTTGVPSNASIGPIFTRVP